MPNLNSTVNKIPCWSCNQTYIRQTNRRSIVRKVEHVNAVRLAEVTSSLTQHVKSMFNIIDCEITKVLATGQKNIMRSHRDRKTTRKSVLNYIWNKRSHNTPTGTFTTNIGAGITYALSNSADWIEEPIYKRGSNSGELNLLWVSSRISKRTVKCKNLNSS